GQLTAMELLLLRAPSGAHILSKLHEPAALKTFAVALHDHFGDAGLRRFFIEEDPRQGRRRIEHGALAFQQALLAGRLALGGLGLLLLALLPIAIELLVL